MTITFNSGREVEVTSKNQFAEELRLECGEDAFVYFNEILDAWKDALDELKDLQRILFKTYNDFNPEER